MPYENRKQAYRSAAVADDYDARRFAGASGRRKHARDGALVGHLLAALPPGECVLDVPCGTGRLRAPLLARGLRVVSADVAYEMLSAQGMDLAALALQADVERLPLRTKSVDAVLCWRFLFHVDQPAARIRILSELARVCRGPIVIQERDARAFKRRLRRLRARFGGRVAPRPAPSLAALEDELRAAGLTIRRVVSVSKLFSDKLAIVAESEAREITRGIT